MSGDRDGVRGTGWKDLMAARPEAGELAELRDAVDRLREAVAALAAADAERPGPAAREEMDALEARLPELVAGAVSGRRADASGDGAGPDSPSGRLEAAAERIEAEGERLAALEGRLAADREAILDAAARTRDVARGGSALLGDVRSEVSALGARMDGTRLRWWMSVLPWTLLGILAGMALEGRTHVAFRIFGWFGL